MIGDSVELRAALELLWHFAQCDVPVLLAGETGTGKELAAREVHYCSARRKQPFVPVNCGALPDALVENELFGHVSGAYTDARAAQPGLVEIAAGGTLFLDEVDTLSPKAQIVLLRFLQDQEFRPVGSGKLRTANVRIISASNADLQKLTNDGQFRHDLFYRLNPLYVYLPPLRDRPGDIALLARHFIRLASKRLGRPEPELSVEALAWLSGYSWPGNVRELESVMLRVVLLSVGPELGVSTLARVGLGNGVSQPPNTMPPGPPADFGRFQAEKSSAIKAFELRYLGELMQRSNGNVTLAARLSGTERRHLGRLLKKHGIPARSALSLSKIRSESGNDAGRRGEERIGSVSSSHTSSGLAGSG
jgi:transcriptional regulator with GAF, ATPase, and Fis domain